MNSHDVNQVAIPHVYQSTDIVFLSQKHAFTNTSGQLHIQYSNRRDAEEAFTAVVRSLANVSGQRNERGRQRNSGDGKGR